MFQIYPFARTSGIIVHDSSLNASMSKTVWWKNGLMNSFANSNSVLGYYEFSERERFFNDRRNLNSGILDQILEMPVFLS